jgi:hypothetical protein
MIEEKNNIINSTLLLIKDLQDENMRLKEKIESMLKVCKLNKLRKKNMTNTLKLKMFSLLKAFVKKLKNF